MINNVFLVVDLMRHAPKCKFYKYFYLWFDFSFEKVEVESILNLHTN